MFWLFIFGFFQRENYKLVKGDEVFYFIESHCDYFVHISFDSTKLYIFKLVTNPLQKLKNGPLYSGHPKLSKFVRFFYMKIWQFDYYKDLKIMKIITACAKIIKVFSTKILIIC